MPRKPKYRKPYPPEFRREAVALYARTDRTLGEIAGDLGVSRESLRLWVQQAQIERGERDGLTGDEREELRELRRRVLLLEHEWEILKKAAALSTRQRNAVSRVAAGVLKSRVRLGRVFSLTARAAPRSR
jgi:transposase